MDTRGRTSLNKRGSGIARQLILVQLLKGRSWSADWQAGQIAQRHLCDRGRKQVSTPTLEFDTTSNTSAAGAQQRRRRGTGNSRVSIRNQAQSSRRMAGGGLIFNAFSRLAASAEGSVTC